MAIDPDELLVCDKSFRGECPEQRASTNPCILAYTMKYKCMLKCNNAPSTIDAWMSGAPHCGGVLTKYKDLI